MQKKLERIPSSDLRLAFSQNFGWIIFGDYSNCENFKIDPGFAAKLLKVKNSIAEPENDFWPKLLQFGVKVWGNDISDNGWYGIKAYFHGKLLSDLPFWYPYRRIFASFRARQSTKHMAKAASRRPENVTFGLYSRSLPILDPVTTAARNLRPRSKLNILLLDSPSVTGPILPKSGDWRGSFTKKKS